VGGRDTPSSSVFVIHPQVLCRRSGMTDTWELVSTILEFVVIPMLGWVLFTIINHGKQIIILEEKVNDSLGRRMTSIETKVVSMETKLESKIDSLQESIVDCKLTINDKLNERFDTLIDRMEQR
jgi:hypothetical protein